MNPYTISQQDIRVICAGCRSFGDYKLLSDTLDSFLRIYDFEMEIVSGTCYGADQLGERYAQERKLCCKQFPAEWKRYGRKAGPIRNRQMADYATHLVAFWDGNKTHSGTWDMIRTATKLNLHVEIVQFSNLNQNNLF